MCEHIPQISVLLPVFNGAHHLSEAIDSILNQTWIDFELIIINDGSKDESADIIKSYSDPRIRFFEQENQGLASTLNKAILLARGVFLARQDADDISLPTRLEKQMKYMCAHPECAILGTWSEIWTDEGRSGRYLQHPFENNEIKLELLFNNPFVHSSILMRRACLENAGLYSEDPLRQPPEDYELWSRIAREYNVANLPEFLVIYREVSGSLSRTADEIFWKHVAIISKENIQSVLGREYDSALIYRVACIFHGVDCCGTHINIDDLVKFMRDLAVAIERHYPMSKNEIERRIMKYIHIAFRYIYSQYVGVRLARYCALIRSVFVFGWK